MIANLFVANFSLLIIATRLAVGAATLEAKNIHLSSKFSQ